MVLAIFSQGLQGDQPFIAEAIDHRDQIVFYFVGWAAQQTHGESVPTINPFGIYVLPISSKKVVLKERHESMGQLAGFGIVKEFP